MDEKSEHFSAGWNKTGLLPLRNDEATSVFNSEGTRLHDSHSCDRETKNDKERKSGYEGNTTSTFQTGCVPVSKDCVISTHGWQSFCSISEQEEQEEQVFQDDSLGIKSSKDKVKLPSVNTCDTTVQQQTRPTMKAETNTKAMGHVEITLPPIKGKSFPPRRKNAVSCSPLMNASISLPSLKNSGFVNVTNGLDLKQGSRASLPVSPNSSELTNYSDGLAMADRSEIDSIHWLAKKRQKSRTLRRKYDGLLPQISYEGSLNKR